MTSIATVTRRIDEVRRFCQNQIDYDFDPNQPLALTDRAWCAQSILNILDGKIDWQFHA